LSDRYLYKASQLLVNIVINIKAILIGIGEPENRIKVILSKTPWARFRIPAIDTIVPYTIPIDLYPKSVMRAIIVPYSNDGYAAKSNISTVTVNVEGTEQRKLVATERDPKRTRRVVLAR